MTENRPLRIGIILPNFMSHSADGLLESLNQTFQKAGHFTMFVNTQGNLEAERESLKFFAEDADGIIITSCASEYSEIADVIPDQFPIIFLLSHPAGCPKTAIMVNDYSAIYQGIISLLNRKLERIACVVDHRESAAGQAILKAYKDAITASGISYDENIIFDIENFTTFNPTKVFTQVVAHDCDAIFCSTSALTVSMTDCLIYYNHNLTNKPVALLGFGVSEMNITSNLNVDLIRHSCLEITSLAFQSLIYQINHPDEVQKERVLQLKGTLHMHKYNGLNILEDI